MKDKIRNWIVNHIEKVIDWNYKRKLPSKIRQIRKKDKITVLFVVGEIAKWKTEQLYLEMAAHNRFNPIIGITMKIDDKPSESARKVLELISYVQNKGYNYQELIRDNFIQMHIKPDIIIYQEPYSNTVIRGHNYLHNLNSIFISITYGFHSVLLPFNHYQPLKEISWFDCYENDSTAHDAIEYTKGRRKNIVITGLPMSETFLKYSNSKNAWKDSGKKKKIIWAPHHSIGFEYETITYSNFLLIAEQMVKFAEKEKDNIQWAFKPHPLLKSKLETIWGAKKTKDYYDYWKNSQHTQLEEGEYIDLFMQSDAMIHDCDTFTIEYLYTNKPVMFLYGKNHSYNNLNKFAKQAHNLHYAGFNFQDIEKFVMMILRNEDFKKIERNTFYKNYLDIYNGRHASSNIINQILGQ